MAPGLRPPRAHSSLTRIRERYGLEVFRRFFERIVEMCVEAGLVRGEELSFDSTTVKADAARGSLIPRLEVARHIGELFEDESGAEGQDPRVAYATKTDAFMVSLFRVTSTRRREHEIPLDGRIGERGAHAGMLDRSWQCSFDWPRSPPRTARSRPAGRYEPNVSPRSRTLAMIPRTHARGPQECHTLLVGRQHGKDEGLPLHDESEHMRDKPGGSSGMVGEKRGSTAMSGTIPAGSR